MGKAVPLGWRLRLLSYSGSVYLFIFYSALGGQWRDMVSLIFLNDQNQPDVWKKDVGQQAWGQGTC